MPKIITRGPVGDRRTVVVDDEPVVEEELEPVGMASPTEPGERMEVVRTVDPVVQTDRTVHGHRVERNLALERSQAIHQFGQIIGLVFGIIEGLIAIRLILALLGASPANGFANFIYTITSPLVAPFVGLTGSPAFGTSVLDAPSIVALIVYAVLGWVIIRAAMVAFGAPESRRVSTVEKHRHEDEF